MSDRGPWGTEDFEALSWHDVRIHGVRLERFNEDEGSAELVLDIDYILKWEKSDNSFLFTVCQAILRFHSVFNLKFELNYAAPSAGMCPFSVSGIEREVLVALMATGLIGGTSQSIGRMARWSFRGPGSRKRSSGSRTFSLSSFSHRRSGMRALPPNPSNGRTSQRLRLGAAAHVEY
jgi:hypothetical protein